MVVESGAKKLGVRIGDPNWGSKLGIYIGDPSWGFEGEIKVAPAVTSALHFLH